MGQILIDQALAIEAAAVAMHDCARLQHWPRLARLRLDCVPLIARYRELRKTSVLSRRQSKQIGDTLLRILSLDAQIRELQYPASARLDALLQAARRAPERPEAR